MRNKALPLSMALFAILVWGLSYSVTRSAVQQIPPLTLACLRFFIAALVLWLLTRKNTTRFARGDAKWICALALSGITFYFAFENSGLARTTASHASLIIATIPLGTELVVAWRLRRWPAGATWLGSLMALGGVTWLVGRGEGGATLLGDLLVFGAVACWIAYTFQVQHIAGRYPNLIVTRWIMLIGAITLLPGAVVELHGVPLPRPGGLAWAQVFFLGLFCSAAAFDLWNRAVPALGPTAVNTLIYFIPLIGVAGGILFLDEPLTPALFGGAALIFGGVILAQRSRRS